MMGYKDMTWCTAKKCLDKADCDRYFTAEHHEAALRWWGSDSYPIVMGVFTDCYSEEEEDE